ncbi:hypothetical protein BT96DRAFT_754677, partial [Gymnopus androsaceus JB14]
PVSSKSKSSSLSFIEGHPFANTHVISLQRNHEKIIPNFLGGPLPRPDKEYREFYCSTMLTLFRPWRSGKDLRSATEETWHDALLNYNFNNDCIFYMKNINLQYECLDARDDYRAQLKAG